MTSTEGEVPDRALSGFSQALAGALSEAGLTLSELRRQLVQRGNPVGLSTLSYWRSGQRVPESADSLLVVRDIEEILGLPRGLLARVAAASRHPAPGSGGIALEQLVQRDGVAAVLDELSLDSPLNGLARTWSHGAAAIGADRRLRLLQSHGLFRATRTGIDRLAQLFLARQPVPDGALRLTETTGCTPGRMVSRPELGLFAVELLLPRMLRNGEEVLLEWGYEPPSTAPSSHFEFYLPEPVADVMLTVAFHPDQLPRTVEAFRDSATSSGVLPLDVDGFTTMHHHERDFGPGRLALRWEW